MSLEQQHRHSAPPPAGPGCEAVRAAFSEYLDGALSGRERTELAAHLEGCKACAQEFRQWQSLQAALCALPLPVPAGLETTLRSVLAAERDRGSHLNLPRRFALNWQRSLAPLALRFSGALVAAVVLVGCLGWLFAAPIAVQANDDRMAHLVAPQYLYSQVPPQPIVTRHDAPVVVEAWVDTQGRVYDYSIVTGPQDRTVQLGVAQDLLASVFRPATVFGVPVRGHLVITYSGVSVHG